MYRRLKSLAIAAAICLLPTIASAEPDTACRHDAIAHLRAASADGYAVYRQASDPGSFETWIHCDFPRFDLPTAVHETTHLITADTDSFPLVGGGAIARPHQAEHFFPPARIARRFKTDDFVSIYLRPGKASSSQNFMDLLDEFNAYTHDLNAAVDLRDLKTSDSTIDHRDGLAAMMAFVAVYAETARASEPRTWRGLQEPPVATALSALWSRAERVMASSCGIPDFGHLDKGYIRRTCGIGRQSALGQILGRSPVCAQACLAPERDEPPEDTIETVASRTIRVATRQRPRRLPSDE